MDTRTIKSVAITGAGSGLGRELALGFLEKGYIVFGIVINDREIPPFYDVPSRENLFFTVMDITKDNKVTSWYKEVIDTLAGGGLDILINNAGVLTPGPMEALTIDAIRFEFEVKHGTAKAGTGKIQPGTSVTLWRTLRRFVNQLNSQQAAGAGSEGSCPAGYKRRRASTCTDTCSNRARCR